MSENHRAWLESAVVRSNLVSYFYGTRRALTEVSFEVPSGSTVAFLGPNGSGKTTLFKVLCTLAPDFRGDIWMLGKNFRTNQEFIRQNLGIVFQSPSLDKKLTVLENLRFHGWIHGISGDKLRTTIELRLKQVQLWDRQNEKVEKLSGGLQRRVELAKSLMTEPSLLILDEPSTGLDPALRLEFWKVLKQYQAEKKASILFTTHLMEEADRATHVIFLDEGKKIAEGSPEVLKAQIGGEILTLETRNLEKVYNGLEKDFGLKPRRTPEGTLELEVAPGSLKGAEWIPRLAAGFVSELDAISLRKPTLEDFFLQKTGRKLSADTAE